jgi:cytochrome c oxidase subunit 1
LATTAISTPAYGGEYSGEQSGLWSWLSTVDHKRIGILYLYTALFFFMFGGVEALIIRAQLGAPNQHLVSA